MARLVKLTHPNGECVWVNPELVLTVEADGRGPGSLVAFAVAGRNWSDGPGGETEPYRIAVCESPLAVAQLLLGPGYPAVTR